MAFFSRSRPRDGRRRTRRTNEAAATESASRSSESTLLSNTSRSKGKRWPTHSKKCKQPIQEAVQAEQRFKDKAQATFDEFQILRFRAIKEKSRAADETHFVACDESEPFVNRAAFVRSVKQQSVQVLIL